MHFLQHQARVLSIQSSQGSTQWRSQDRKNQFSADAQFLYQMRPRNSSFSRNLASGRRSIVLSWAISSALSPWLDSHRRSLFGFGIDSKHGSSAVPAKLIVDKKLEPTAAEKEWRQERNPCPKSDHARVTVVSIGILWSYKICDYGFNGGWFDNQSFTEALRRSVWALFSRGCETRFVHLHR